MTTTALHNPIRSACSPLLLAAICSLACSMSDDVTDADASSQGDDAATADGELETDGGLETGGEESTGCVSSHGTTPECEYPGAGVDCPNPEHVCGFVGENKQTMIPTCVCLDDPDVCFVPPPDYECGGHEDCDGSGDASCVDGKCVCNP